EANNQTISINSVMGTGGASTVANSVTLTDNTTTAAANQATTMKVTGAGNVTVTYADIGTATDKLATIDASGSSGAVNVSAVQGATTGLTITGGSGALTAKGSGAVTGESAASYLNAVDTIKTGSGGGTITVGYAGAGAGTGSTTVNLSASAATASTITTSSDATYGGRAAIQGYVSSANTASADTLGINGTTAQTLLTTVATAQVVPTGTGVGSDTYTVSDGVITLSGSDTAAVQLADAKAIVATAGFNHIAAFSDGTNSYVISSGAAGTSTSTNGDHVYTLSGVTNITEVGGATAATGNVLLSGSTVVTGVTATAITTGATAVSQSDTGNFVQAISGSGTAGVTLSGLGASATIDDSATGNYALTVSQAGVSGSDSLTINSSGAHTYTTLTDTTDAALTLNATAATIVTSLVDSGNTLATLNISGTAAATVSGITDTALVTINVSDTAAVNLGTSSAALSQTGLHVDFGSSAASLAIHSGTAIYLSGAGDTVDATNATTSSAAASSNVLISATGSGSTVLGGADTGGTGLDIITGANSTVTMLQGVAAGVGVAAVTGDAGANLITVGNNSTVTLGTNSSGAASDGGSTINVAGDTTGMVTINNVNHSSTLLTLFSAGTTETLHLVNVASATTLAAAENMAVTVASNAGTSGNNYDAVFNWTDGNTYIIGHSGAAETTLSSSDVVVKLVGLISPTTGGITSHVIHL
uniref:beta strand repeat-containing protein n=1 Tax=Ferrovum sp. TaxID=2609467 RepID=UPI0026169C54